MGNIPPTLIVITGPTASGKSALAVEVARRLHSEVVSADSRQIYRDIPIVTATPTEEEMMGVPHHLIGMLPLDAYYSASEFETDALAIVRRLLSEHGVAIVCGGSMMYVDALCNGIDELPTVPVELRESLMEDWRRRGDEWLRGELRRLDPVHYDRVDLNNMKRVFHAVEISQTAGCAYSSLLTGQKRDREFRIVKAGLDGEREELFRRINGRVEQMMLHGLEEEARRVYAYRHLNSLNTVGLKEMFAWFDGLMTKEEAVMRIQKNTRVYAKKQLTWHKRDERLQKLDFSEGMEKKVERILTLLRSTGDKV